MVSAFLADAWRPAGYHLGVVNAALDPLAAELGITAVGTKVGLASIDKELGHIDSFRHTKKPRASSIQISVHDL